MAAFGMATTQGVDLSSQPRYASAAHPFSVEYRPLADSSQGTYQALDAMRLAVLGALPPDFSGYSDGYNKRAADAICASVRDTHDRAQIAALFDFVAHDLAYVPHPENFQIVQDCRRTLQIRSGDCVSKSVCLATLLACRGVRSRFVAQNDGAEFFHVYVEALTPEGWLALDPVADSEPIGWTQPLPDRGFETTWEIFP